MNCPQEEFPAEKVVLEISCGMDNSQQLLPGGAEVVLSLGQSSAAIGDDSPHFPPPGGNTAPQWRSSWRPYPGCILGLVQ